MAAISAFAFGASSKPATTAEAMASVIDNFDAQVAAVYAQGIVAVANPMTGDIREFSQLFLST